MGDFLEPVALGNGIAGEPRKAVKAAAGVDYTCVLSAENEVVCFGHNDMGQLGVEHAKDVGKVAWDMGDELVPVDFGSGSGYAVDITSGPCALLSDGTVKVRPDVFPVGWCTCPSVIFTPPSDIITPEGLDYTLGSVISERVVLSYSTCPYLL